MIGHLHHSNSRAWQLLLSILLVMLGCFQLSAQKRVYEESYRQSFQRLIDREYDFIVEPTLTSEQSFSDGITLLKSTYKSEWYDVEEVEESREIEVEGYGLRHSSGKTLPPIFTKIERWRDDKFILALYNSSEYYTRYFIISDALELTDYCEVSQDNLLIRSEGRWGVLSTKDLRQLVPFEYEDFSSGERLVNRYGRDQMGDMEGVLYSAKKGGKWGKVETIVGEVIPFEYDSVGTQAWVDRTQPDSYATDEREMSYFVVRKEGKMGLVKYGGNVVIAAKYDRIERVDFSIGAAKAALNERWGMVSLSGEEVVSFIYQEIDWFDNDTKSMPVKQNGRWGLLDGNGKQLLACNYEEVGRFYPELKEVVVKQNGKWGAVDLTGAIVIAIDMESEQEVIDSAY